MDLKFADFILKGLTSMDRPIGRLMEMAKALGEGEQKSALMDISGEMLRSQFELIDAIVSKFPEHDPSV